MSITLKSENSKNEISIYKRLDISFDWEVLPNFFCVTFLISDPDTKIIKDRITFRSYPSDDVKTYNELKKLAAFFKEYKDKASFIAWNVNYDKRITFEILKKHKEYINNGVNSHTFNQKELCSALFETSKKIVHSDEVEFVSFALLGYDNIVFYDAMKYMVNNKSLKVSGGESGYSMLESTIPWNKEILSESEINELITYNIHDVDVLYRLLLKYYDYYEIRKDLVNEFSPNNHTYLEYKNNAFFNLIYKLSKSDALSDIPEHFNFYNELERPELAKLKHVISVIENKENLHPIIKGILDKLKTEKIPTKNEKWEIVFKNKEMFGMDGIFALGGLHASSDGMVLSNVRAVMKDVASYYPNGFINYNLQSRAIKEKDKYLLKHLKDQRLIFKHSNDPNLKKKDKAYKVLINANYGLSRASIANIADPVNGTILCIMGQILLLYLCNLIDEYVESFIQLNTDGIYYVPKSGKEDIINNLCSQWEKETSFELETDISTKTFNFNVNNYILQFDNGKLKIKGRYINQYSVDILQKSAMELTYDTNILSKLVVNLLIYKKSFNETLKEFPEAWRYQAIKKITSSYDSFVFHNGIEYVNTALFIEKLNVIGDTTLEVPVINKVEGKVQRFFAIKNGKAYYKYKNAKNFENFKDEISYDENNLVKLIKKSVNNKSVILLLKKLKAKKYKEDTFKLDTKMYLGEKVAGISESSIIYNKPLFHNYESKYTFEKSDIKTLSDIEKELGIEIDLEYYKNEARNLILNVYNLENELKYILPNYKQLME